MNYTIAELEECNMGYGHLKHNIDVSGDKYLVGLYNDETKQFTHRVFRTIDQAYTFFGKLSEWIVKGLYTEDEKRKYLAEAEV